MQIWITHSLYRIEFFVSLLYLSVYRLQVNVYYKQWWQALVLLDQTTISVQGAYTESDNAPV